MLLYNGQRDAPIIPHVFVVSKCVLFSMEGEWKKEVNMFGHKQRPLCTLTYTQEQCFFCLSEFSVVSDNSALLCIEPRKSTISWSESTQPTMLFYSRLIIFYRVICLALKSALTVQPLDILNSLCESMRAAWCRWI